MVAINAAASPSGESIPISFLDANGKPTALLSVALGGDPITITIPGSPPIACSDTLYYAHPTSAAMILIPQPSPRVVTVQPRDVETEFSYAWMDDRADVTLRGRAVFTNDPTATGTIHFSKVTRGTYEVGGYWIPTPTNYYGTIYTPSTATHFSVVDEDGTVLATAIIDQTVPLTDYTDLGVGWRIIFPAITTTRPRSRLSLIISAVGLSATANVVAVLHAIQLRRTSADPLTVIPPGVSATISIPAGKFTTALGVVEAITDQAVSPRKAILPAKVAGPKTARIGYNIGGTPYYSHVMMFANLSYQANWDTDAKVIARAANGYPTKISSPTCHVMIGGGASIPGMPKGNNPFPQGVYTLLWDGDARNTIDSFGSSITAITEIGTPTRTGVENRRTFQVSVPANLGYSPFLSLLLAGTFDPTDGHYFVDVRNVRIYPPDPADPTGETAWLNPPKYAPSYTQAMHGATSLRAMDGVSTIGNNWSGASHFKQDAHCSRSQLQRTVTSAVVSIGNPTGARYFAPNARVVQVKTATPHLFFTAEFVHLIACGVANFADGSTVDLADTRRAIYVLDATNFLVLLDDRAAPTTMTGTLTGGSVEADQGTPLSLADLTDLVAAVPTVTDFYLNYPSSIDLTPGGDGDAVHDHMAAHLPAGVKFHPPFGNEEWNMVSPQYTWAHASNEALHGGGPYDFEIYYADSQKALHDRVQARFTAAGRPDDVVYTYEGFAARPEPTANIANRARANGARMDEFAVAPYFNNRPTWGLTPMNQEIGNRVTVGQNLDCLDFNLLHGGYETYFTAHRPMLDAAGYATTKLTTYEVAPETLVMRDFGYAGPPGDFEGFFPLHYATKRHPRFGDDITFMLQTYQDSGMDVWDHYPLSGGDYTRAWDAVDYSGQRPGTADATLDAINISDPTAMNRVTSEVAGALQRWAALVPPVTPKEPPMPTIKDLFAEATGDDAMVIADEAKLHDDAAKAVTAHKGLVDAVVAAGPTAFVQADGSIVGLVPKPDGTIETTVFKDGSVVAPVPKL